MVSSSLLGTCCDRGYSTRRVPQLVRNCQACTWGTRFCCPAILDLMSRFMGCIVNANSSCRCFMPTWSHCHFHIHDTRCASLLSRPHPSRRPSMFKSIRGSLNDVFRSAAPEAPGCSHFPSDSIRLHFERVLFRSLICCFVPPLANLFCNRVLVLFAGPPFTNREMFGKPYQSSATCP